MAVQPAVACWTLMPPHVPSPARGCGSSAHSAAKCCCVGRHSSRLHSCCSGAWCVTCRRTGVDGSGAAPVSPAWASEGCHPARGQQRQPVTARCYAPTRAGTCLARAGHTCCCVTYAEALEPRRRADAAAACLDQRLLERPQRHKQLLARRRVAHRCGSMQERAAREAPGVVGRCRWRSCAHLQGQQLLAG